MENSKHSLSIRDRPTSTLLYHFPILQQAFPNPRGTRTFKNIQERNPILKIFTTKSLYPKKRDTRGHLPTQPSKKGLIQKFHGKETQTTQSLRLANVVPREKGEVVLLFFKKSPPKFPQY
jgi:hypothetical protein